MPGDNPEQNRDSRERDIEPFDFREPPLLHEPDVREQEKHREKRFTHADPPGHENRRCQRQREDRECARETRGPLVSAPR